MAERFAFKIDKALKLNLYKICRLCGIDNPEKVNILPPEDAVINVDGEPELSRKIQDCVGFHISKNDKMPQTMCVLCVDKINDFYEFREMCFATNIQTRKLLGLKGEEPKKKPMLDIKPDIYIKDESTWRAPTNLPGKRGRKRKSDEPPIVQPEPNDLDAVKKEGKKLKLAEPLPSASKKQKPLTPQQKRLQERMLIEQALKPKEEIKEEPLQEPTNTTVNPKLKPTTTIVNPKLKQLCTICNERFATKIELERHKAGAHVPNIPRYMCTACNETIKKGNDIKNHQLWHKLSKTPYLCALCGDLLFSIYQYTRHMRDHVRETPTALLVLDRECPQCHQAFATNFLYNTHPCAVRTKKCAGCNRLLRNESDYMRHAASCPKMYLTYSKHIPAAALAAESCIRIKNENDVEAAAAAEALARRSGISLDMTPVVAITRMSTPVLMAANQCVAIPSHSGEIQPDTPSKLSKKNNKKGVSSKELKRVDELLKSTMDALVSIKHEPEIHVETDEHAAADGEEANDDDALMNEYGGGGDHHDDDDFDYVNDEANKGAEGVISVTENVNSEITIKKEILEEGAVEGGSANKMPVLKLKIKKEHGMLNSSLVDDGSTSEKKRKKKKRKDTERNRDKTVDKNQNTEIGPIESVLELSMAHLPGPVVIKQERLDEDTPLPNVTHDHVDEQMPSQAEATVMTSIPLMQISYISSGVSFEGDATTAQSVDLPAQAQDEPRDVKPNRLELDRMLKISNVSSGVTMGAEEEEHEVNPSRTICPTTRTATRKSPAKKQKSTATTTRAVNTGKAVKSTGGIERSARKSHSTSVGSDEAFQMANIIIKPEPRNRGYGDEVATAAPVAVDQMDCDETASAPAQMDHEFMIQEVDEQAYIDTIDFNNIKIKQEKEIEISEVQLSNQEISANAPHNGVVAVARKAQTQKRNRSGRHQSVSASTGEEDREEVESEHSNEEDDEEEVEEEEEEEEENEDFEEEEEREYRELELPPLLVPQVVQNDANEADNNKMEQENQNKLPSSNIEAEAVYNNDKTEVRDEQQPQTSSTFVISNVFSQATEDTEGGIESQEQHSSDDSLNLKISAVVAGCSDVTFSLKSTETVAASAEEVATPAEEDATPTEADVTPTEVLATPTEHLVASTVAAVTPTETVEMATEALAASTGVTAISTEAVAPSTEALATPTETLGASTEPVAADHISPNESEEVIKKDEVTNKLPTSPPLHTEEQTVGPADTIVGQITDESTEVPLKAQPFFEQGTEDSALDALSDNSDDEEDDAVEEQQNLMNQEMADQVATESDILAASVLRLHPYLEDISSGSGSAFSSMASSTPPIASTSSSAVAKANHEETENIINENADAALSRQMQAASSSRISSLALMNHNLLLDDSNINEIAENNNNANIERELQDDSVALARLEQGNVEPPPNEAAIVVSNDIT